MRMNARQAGGGKRSTADRLMCYANLVFVLFSQRFLHCSFCTLRVWVCVCLAFDHIQHGETGNEMRCPPCLQLVAKPALVPPALTECPWQRALNCLFISTRGAHQARKSNKIFTPTNTHTNTQTRHDGPPNLGVRTHTNLTKEKSNRPYQNFRHVRQNWLRELAECESGTKGGVWERQSKREGNDGAMLPLPVPLTVYFACRALPIFMPHADFGNLLAPSFCNLQGRSKELLHKKVRKGITKVVELFTFFQAKTQFCQKCKITEKTILDLLYSVNIMNFFFIKKLLIIFKRGYDKSILTFGQNHSFKLAKTVTYFQGQDIDITNFFNLRFI